MRFHGARAGPSIGDGLGFLNDGPAPVRCLQITIRCPSGSISTLRTSSLGPNLRIEPETDPISGRVIALHMTGTVDRPPHTIWLDGRPHPSKNGLHTFGGFTTGVWEGNALLARTTHLKEGMVWRNGVPHSDQATMTEHYVRHATF